jgi:hypothetical protein
MVMKTQKHVLSKAHSVDFNDKSQFAKDVEKVLLQPKNIELQAYILKQYFHVDRTGEKITEEKKDKKDKKENEILISNVSIELETLAFAGALETQRLFAIALIAVTKSAQNRKWLLSKEGSSILKRLLWCSSWDDKETKSNAYKALELLSKDTQDIVLLGQATDDVEILRWVAINLFRVTINPQDESAHHILYTEESEHPYQQLEIATKYISIPGASKIKITFDPKSNTDSNNDFVAFYMDENKSDMFPNAKFSGSHLSSASLTLDNDEFWLYFQSGVLVEDGDFVFMYQ